jgi:hypothetical protein
MNLLRAKNEESGALDYREGPVRQEEIRAASGVGWWLGGFVPKRSFGGQGAFPSTTWERGGMQRRSMTVVLIAFPPEISATVIDRCHPAISFPKFMHASNFLYQRQGIFGKFL